MRRCTFGGAVLLHEVEARERHVEARGLGVLEDHELGVCAVGLRDFFQSLVLADAVLDVDNVVVDGEIAEVGDEGGGLRFGARRARRVDLGFVEEIARAEDGEARIGDGDAFGHERLHDGGADFFAGKIGGVVDIGFARTRSAAAEAERHAVLGENFGESLDFSGGAAGEEHALILRR